jgi:carboxymethylenebutenolidase
MCHDANSAPPVFSEPKTAVHSRRQILTSPGQAQFAAFLATPEESAGTGVVILPDIRGLHPFYEQLAPRVAEHGHTALAIDYFGRTAGTAPRGASFQHMEHILRVSRQTIDADILTAASFLRSAAGPQCKNIFALGFCFGGRQAFFASAARFGFSGVVGYYGALGPYPNGATGPLQHAAELSAPILGLFGGADHGISGKDVAAFDAALTRNGVDHDFVIYPDAPHSFFDIKYSEHAAACADSWRRVLAFLDRRDN